MNFEFDNAKSMRNKLKHGITLEEAQQLWVTPAIELEARSIEEARHMIIGRIDGKCYSCIYTIRGGATRLISARRARQSEEALYYEHIKA